MTPSAVFDCMVFVQAVANENGAAAGCFRLVEEGSLALFMSHEILEEIEEVLGREKLRRKLPGLTTERAERFLEAVKQRAPTVTEVAESFTLERDPKDEPYLNLAITANADYLVTRDRDMLDLMQDEGFRDQYPQLTILDPAALLRVWKPPDPLEE